MHPYNAAEHTYIYLLNKYNYFDYVNINLSDYLNNNVNCINHIYLD
jgi:hypothetical protein